MFLTFPEDINITTDEGESFGTAYWDTPKVFDMDNFTVNSTHKPGDMFDIGSTTVTYVVRDIEGNTNQATFTVFVRGWYRF